MDKTTLVTGGTGLVGYNIIVALLKRNRKVRALVRSIEKGENLLPSEVELVQGDITDKESLVKAMEGCNIVYHTAGYPEQWKKDTTIFDKVNVGGTEKMIEVALALKIEKFIYTSTIDVFVGKAHELYDESEIDPNPKNTIYEQSKQKAFQSILAATKKGLPVISLHPAGVYGPGPASSPGMNDFFLDLKNGKVPMLLPGGLPMVFSEDVGEGHVLAEGKGKIGESYILSEAYYLLTEIAKLALKELDINKKPPFVMPLSIVRFVSNIGESVSKITGKPPLIPKGQLEFLLWKAIPSSKKAQTELGWQPTPLTKGIQKTIESLFE